jgi:hypothetical protein
MTTPQQMKQDEDDALERERELMAQLIDASKIANESKEPSMTQTILGRGAFYLGLISILAVLGAGIHQIIDWMRQ